MNNIIFSVIIPHRNSVEMLSKLLMSIPNNDNIEVIVVDNSPIKISKSEIFANRPFSLYYSEPKRGAGGARNKGLEHAQGEWLLFADADDYFTSNAFDVFFSKIYTEADIVYTCMDGIYIDNGEHSNRGDTYTKLVKNFLLGVVPEADVRFNYSSPCGKMIRHKIVKEHHIRYDEVTASNDVYFSMLVGFFSKKIEAVDSITYIITTNRGSLTQRRDYAVIRSRFEVNLRYNKFMKQHGYPEYQRSIIFYMLTLVKINFKNLFFCIKEIIKYNQNPFVGASRWINSYFNIIKMNKKNKRFIVK